MVRGWDLYLWGFVSWGGMMCSSTSPQLFGCSLSYYFKPIPSDSTLEWLNGATDGLGSLLLCSTLLGFKMFCQPSWFWVFLWHFPFKHGVMGCYAAEATDLGFVCFVVIHPFVSQQSWFGFFFCFMNFPSLLPPFPDGHMMLISDSRHVLDIPSEECSSNKLAMGSQHNWCYLSVQLCQNAQRSHWSLQERICSNIPLEFTIVLNGHIWVPHKHHIFTAQPPSTMAETSICGGSLLHLSGRFPSCQRSARRGAQPCGQCHTLGERCRWLLSMMVVVYGRGLWVVAFQIVSLPFFQKEICFF